LLALVLQQPERWR